MQAFFDASPNQVRMSCVTITIPEENNKEEKKTAKKSAFLSHISDNVSEFMNNSSIHGLKYLVGNDRTLPEK